MYAIRSYYVHRARPHAAESRKVTSTVERDGWQLVEAQERDLQELMSWFRSAGEVDRWGGPRFRYPFTGKTFRKDCHWGRMPSYRLNSPAGEFSAFGQMYQRYGRIRNNFV